MKEKIKTKILIADDNLAWCEILQKYIKQNMESEIEIIGITSDGEEQIQLIETLRPDIVITDLKRPKGISGIDVIRKCNKITEFIIETAGYYKDQFDDIKSMGVNNFLLKPFRL